MRAVHLWLAGLPEPSVYMVVHSGVVPLDDVWHAVYNQPLDPDGDVPIYRAKMLIGKRTGMLRVPGTDDGRGHLSRALTCSFKLWM